MEINRIFLNSDEAAEFLGIAKITLYTYTHKRIIPYYKARRKIYFKVDDLENFVLGDNNRIKSLEEIERDAEEYVKKVGIKSTHV